MRAFAPKIVFTAVALLVASSLSATAGNTTFFTSIGDQTLPLSPPNQATGAAGAIDNMAIGQTTPALGSFSQIISAGGAPNIASGGCGTGTNGSVAGTNQAGTITVGATATTTCTINFSATLPVAPKACVLFPANAAAAATGTTVAYVSAITTAHFVVTGSALANTKYGFICL